MVAEGVVEVVVEATEVVVVVDTADRGATPTVVVAAAGTVAVVPGGSRVGIASTFVAIRLVSPFFRFFCPQPSLRLGFFGTTPRVGPAMSFACSFV